MKSMFAPKVKLPRPRTGFLLGKFLPPTEGHRFLCEFARQYCDHLTILVCSLEAEPIEGKLRYEWMKEMFPSCDVVHFEQPADFPQEPTGPDDVVFWEKWKDAVRYAMQANAPDGGLGGSMWEYPEVVFASEDYGHRLAAEVGARFVPVDISRTARAVSGTKVRSDPFAYWGFIPDVVRPHYVKRVCLFGVESTGKSTLAQQLGHYYSTVVVPEYGRTYTEAFGTEVSADDLKLIVAGHVASVAAAKRQANRILIEDTDPVMTAVWSQMLHDERDPFFDGFSDHADLYLVTDIDIPWVDDGTRYFGTEKDRRRFHETCLAELDHRGIRYEIISGTREERLARATQAIDRFIEGGN